MKVFARAPGKLIVLGEYAVLAGGPALVMAVDRHCSAVIQASTDSACHLRTRIDTDTQTSFVAGQPSGVGLVDLVTGRSRSPLPEPWTATLDSRALFGRNGKLGLGSSAAALTAWAGAWAAYMGAHKPDVTELIAVHREWQGGAGSGLDVAASRLGGVLCYRLGEDGSPDIISVRLPDSVGFVGVCTGQAASTGGLVRRFQAWRENNPIAAHAQVDRMRQIAESGVDAARMNAATDFISAVASYSAALDALGRAVGADIVTTEHRSIAAVAERFGVTYKVSGAGGGDVGVALAADTEALDAFAAAVPTEHEVLRLGIDGAGMVTEIRSV